MQRREKSGIKMLSKFFKKAKRDRKRNVEQAGQIAQNKNVSLNADISIIMLNILVQ